MVAAIVLPFSFSFLAMIVSPVGDGNREDIFFLNLS